MNQLVKLILLGAVAVLTLFGCKEAKPTLHIYTWADYVKPELIVGFEQKHNCQVIIDTFDSNETMYAKLKAGATGYDVLFPSSYMVKLLKQQNMLQDLDHSLLQNTRNVDPDYLASSMDRAMTYSVPYMLTTTGIAYLKSKIPTFEPSWAMFDRPELKGRVTMLNDMRETIGAALKYLGYSINSKDQAQLEQARDVVIRWKSNLAKFENEQYKTGLASGEFLLVHGYSGDIIQVMTENEDISFAVPREGTSMSCDDMVIPTEAKQVALAHAFINYMHDPAVAAENTEFTGYLCPNKAAYELMSEEIKSNPAIFIDAEVKAKSEIIDDLGDFLAVYTKIWDQIKAAK